MSFWGDIEHIVKKAALLDPTVLTVALFEKEFMKKHGRKPNEHEKGQYNDLKLKHGVAGVGDAEDDAKQAQDMLDTLNPFAPATAQQARQNVVQAQAAAAARPFNKGWLVVAGLAWLLWKGKL